jgi:tRNA nucleotidyltransferase (CCA-adding enzyme)
LALRAEISIRQTKVILNRLSDLVKKYNTRIFIVGGPVRDMLMTKKKLPVIEQDLDIAVEDNYQNIGENLAKGLSAKIIRYPQFMTMTLQLKDRGHIDIAQTRKEEYLKPAMLPVVKPATIQDDLKRRDFTINAMALEITGQMPYSIIDPSNGRKDLKDKVVRVLHKQSFIDDPTRIFRAIRFSTRSGFKIEKETQALMKKAIRANLLKLLSGERILYEIKMIMKEKKNTDMLKSLQSYNIISNLFSIHLPKKFFLEQKSLDNDTIKLIHFFSFIPEALWSKYPLFKETGESVKQLKEFPKHRASLLAAKKPSQIYTILKIFNKAALRVLMCLERESARKKIKNYLNKYSKVKIFTTGDMLKSLQMKPGPRYTKIFNELVALKLDGLIVSKSDEIKYIVKQVFDV